MAYVFDCTSDEPLLIKSMNTEPLLANADSYVECGIATFDTEIDNAFRTTIKPNTQGTMNEEKMIINYIEKKLTDAEPTEEKKEDAETEEKEEKLDDPIEIEDSQVLGLYRTYSTYDLTMVKKMMKSGSVGKFFDISVLWALFGQQTVFNILS